MKIPTLKEVRDCMEKLNAVTDPVILELSFVDAFTIITQLQLALRHPGNTGEGADLVRAATLTIQEGLASRVPCVDEALGCGWSDQEDEMPFLYQNLPMINKRQLVANSHTLGQACTALSRIVDDGRTPEDWFKALSLQTVYYLETVPDSEIYRIVRKMDQGVSSIIA